MRARRGFVPHWFMMLMLIGAGIVIPVLSRMFAR